MAAPAQQLEQRVSRRRRGLTLAALVVILAAACMPAPTAAVTQGSPLKAWVDTFINHVRDGKLQSQVTNKFLGLLGQSWYNALKENRKLSGDDAAAADVGADIDPSTLYANETAVAAFTAHTFLTTWFPWKFAAHDLLISAQLDGLSDEELDKAEAIGTAAANNVSATRIGDGFATWSRFKPAPYGTIGAYQSVPNYTTETYPQIGWSLPLVITREEAAAIADKYVNIAREWVFSETYYRDLEYVRAVGPITGSNRTDYDNDTPRFWDDGSGTHTVAGHILDVAAQVLPTNWTLLQQARFYAQYGSAVSDSSLVCYRTKFLNTSRIWRPIHAIRQGDNSNLYTADPEWTPVLLTPPHPTFPSGHRCTTSAAVQVILTYVPDAVDVTIGSEGLPGVNRTYTSLQQISYEEGISRVLGGVHFTTDVEGGADLGTEVAKRVLELIK